MCGVAGFLGSLPPGAGGLLDSFNTTQAHRGPDGEGFYLGEGIGLVHTLLSIVDVSHGHQPMSNEDDTLWVTYNGEIYNHMDFRADLQLKGHHFKSQCDTEILLHLYEEHGDNFLQLLNGMFAFGLWDARRNRLLLARDRMGIKPLYYARTAEALIFASEAKAIFASGLVRPELDPRSIDNFFSFTYPLPPVPCLAVFYRYHRPTASPSKAVRRRYAGIGSFASRTRRVRAVSSRMPMNFRQL